MSTNVILVCCYSGFLLAVAYGFDFMARRVSLRAQRWRTGAFHYHPDHDAWICPENQWLWPTSYDPEQRIIRYRAKPSVCNACPVKHSCTTSPHGREVTREIDPWPHSEAGRFHRGIACVVAVIGVLLPLGMLFSGPSALDLLALLAMILLVGVASVPLARHLWHTPSGFPEHIPQRTVYDEPPADRFATRWGSLRTNQTTSKEST
jgi:Transposase DDE domain